MRVTDIHSGEKDYSTAQFQWIVRTIGKKPTCLSGLLKKQKSGHEVGRGYFGDSVVYWEGYRTDMIIFSFIIYEVLKEYI